MSNLSFYPHHLEVCLAHCRRATNIIPMNEWSNFTLNSDDQMQRNLKAHGTQEKNNEADYLMSMRKSIIFLLNKKKEKQRFTHFQVKIFHSFHLWFVLQGETNSKAVLCSVLGWCACCCFLRAVSAVDLNWIISFPCLEPSWPWPGAVISFFTTRIPAWTKVRLLTASNLKCFLLISDHNLIYIWRSRSCPTRFSTD